MNAHTLRRETFIARPRAEVFAFFSSAFNLASITPAYVRLQVLTPQSVEMRAGTLLDYKLRIRGLPIRWRTEIVEWGPPHGFRDIQVRGPFALWDHSHCFEERNGGTLMRDEVRYALGFGPLGEIARRLMVARDVERIFEHRAGRIRELFRNPTRPSPER